MIEQSNVIDELKKFNKVLIKTVLQCVICFEAWPNKALSKKKQNGHICTRCIRDKKTPKKFSFENNMVPCPVPEELKGMTQCEEMLICRAFPVMQVYAKPRFGTYSYKGHVITLPHNVQKVANILPHCPQDLPIITFTVKGQDNNNLNFKVRREKFLNALLWLKTNNPVYRDIEIDIQRVNLLPTDGYLDLGNLALESSTDNVAYDQGPIVDNELKNEMESSSFITGSDTQPLEQTRLHQCLNESPNLLEIGTDPFNEFSTPCLATLAFPTLFPDVKGDPTNNANQRQISESDTESFAQKLKHLIKFGERENGKWNYRFASHPRFGYWAYNMLYRKRLLSQGNFYIKKNFGERLMTVDELRHMLASENHSQIMNKLMYYAKNISGTNSYWYQVKEQLKATLQQVGSPTIFWTLSCAEFHWPEFHAMFSDNKMCNITSKEAR